MSEDPSGTEACTGASRSASSRCSRWCWSRRSSSSSGSPIASSDPHRGRRSSWRPMSRLKSRRTSRPSRRWQLDPYLREKFGHIYQPFLVVLHDGRFGSNRFDRLPPGFARAVLPRARRGGRFGDPGRGGEPWRAGRGRGGGGFDGRGGPPEPGPPPDSRGPRPDRAGPPAGPPPGPRTDRGPDPRMGDRPPDPDGRGGGGGRRFESAPILVDAAEVGLVIVPAEAPPVFVAVREMGPTLAWFALGLLGVGAVVHRPGDLQADAQPAAGARAGSLGARPGSDRGPCRRKRRRRGQLAGADVQPHGGGSRGARERAGGVGPRPTAAPGRRLARTDDAADGHPWLHRNARHGRPPAG